MLALLTFALAAPALAAGGAGGGTGGGGGAGGGDNLTLPGGSGSVGGSGGGGGGGGSGITGGPGGRGNSGVGGTAGAGGAAPGSAGQDGQDFNGAGGGGGGAHGSVDVAAPTVSVSGGNGGNGGNDLAGSGGGGGGAGGYGAVITGTGALGLLTWTTTGGNGGNGGSGQLEAANAGSGGIGLAVTGGAGTSLTINASVRGGDGGAGGNSSVGATGGTGGNGGAGLIGSNGASFVVNGAVRGGDGGAGGSGIVPGSTGRAGAGISGQSLSITLGASGSISGGLGGGGAHGNALELSGNSSLTVAAAGTANLTGNIALGAGTLTLDQSNGVDITIANAMTGTGALAKTGSGTVTLSGNNDYSGATSVLGGRLVADSSTAFSANSHFGVAAGATIEIASAAGFGATVGALSGAGNVIIGNGTMLTIGAKPVATIFSGQISGPGSLSLDGPGALSLTGTSNSIEGLLLLCGCSNPTLEINGGSLSVGDPAGGSGSIAVAGGTLRVVNGGRLHMVDPFGLLAMQSNMEVSGPNSLVTVEGFTGIGGPSNVGLSISAGAAMESRAEAAIEGIGSSTTVTVTGRGSSWTVGSNLFVGGYSFGGTGALTISAGGTVNSSGPLWIGSDPDPLFGFARASVSVTGAGSVLNANGGLLVGYPGCGCGDYTGALTAADGGTVNAGAGLQIGRLGTLAIGGGGLAGTINAPAIVNDGAILANFADVSILAANISGTGTLTKQGSGQLILTGSNSYTGATAVLSGLLTVNGSLTGSAITLAGGSLGGSGTVGSVTVGNAGMVAPGNSIGTLTVAGNITFAPGSTYQVEVDAAGQSDRIAATGTATVSGGTVQLLAAQGSYGPSTRYTILTAQGGIMGQFAAVTSNFAFLTPSLAYGAKDVALTLDRNAIAFPQLALTRNQAGAAGAAEALGASNRVYDALITASVTDARAGFDGLSGEVHAQAVGVAIEDSHLIRESILNRLRWPLAVGASGTVEGAFSADRPGRSAGATLPAPSFGTDRFTLWGEALGAQGRTDSDHNAASLDRRGGGVLFGAEFNATRTGTGPWRLGIAGGYTRTDFDVDGRRSSGELGSTHGALYGGTRFGAVSLRAGAAYAWSDLDVTRRVALPGISDVLRFDGRSATAQAFAEIGYALPYGAVSFEPFAQIAAVTVRTSRDAETGGATALQVLGRDQRLGFTTLGLRAEMQLGAMPLLARGMLGWRHAFGDTTPAANLAFIGAATPFQTYAAPLARDALVAEAGLAWRTSASTTLGVSYSAAISDSARDHALKGRLDVRF